MALLCDDATSGRMIVNIVDKAGNLVAWLANGPEQVTLMVQPIAQQPHALLTLDAGGGGQLVMLGAGNEPFLTYRIPKPPPATSAPKRARRQPPAGLDSPAKPCTIEEPLPRGGCCGLQPAPLVGVLQKGNFFHGQPFQAVDHLLHFGRPPGKKGNPGRRQNQKSASGRVVRAIPRCRWHAQTGTARDGQGQARWSSPSWSATSIANGTATPIPLRPTASEKLLRAACRSSAPPGRQGKQPRLHHQDGPPHRAGPHGVRFDELRDLQGAKVDRWLANKKAADNSSPSTLNGYLTAMKGFCQWLADEDRLRKSPLDHLNRQNTKVDRRRNAGMRPQKRNSPGSLRRLETAASPSVASQDRTGQCFIPWRPIPG